MKAIAIFVLAAAGMWAADGAFVKSFCESCHQGSKPAGGLNLLHFEDLHDADALAKVAARVRNGEMPPKGLPAPSLEARTQFVDALRAAMRTQACAAGLQAGPYPMRRLNRDEYSATVRDLLNIHVNAAHALPADGAGGEGFDNAAETLFISPIHAEKYLEAAKEAVDYGLKDPKSRKSFLPAEPGAGVTPEQAAEKALGAFVPRAFRRPARAGEAERYLALFRGAIKRGDSYNQAISLALEAVLISPNFLFRFEEPNERGEQRELGGYALASRLSYFLWGSMPDQTLFDLAGSGQLDQPATISAQVERMLADEKAREFATRFVEQWLGTRELGRDIKPDEKLFPLYYDAEIQSAIRYEPVLFFEEILAKNLSLLNLLDAKFSVLTNRLAKLYGIDAKNLKQQPLRVDLPEGSHRGGILTMSAVLAVSSYPQRTSPVLRGKWILENVLGTPPPPPPANVPALPENHAGAAAKTLRERLEQHRADPTCASCHSRIDPLGFALENFDVLGRWRAEEDGKAIDSRGELPDGTQIEGPDALKKVLLERKESIMRNFTAKMLGYALGRGLTAADGCTVNRIMERLEKDDYKAQTLMKEIALSVPFRFRPSTIKAGTIKAGTIPAGTIRKAETR